MLSNKHFSSFVKILSDLVCNGQAYMLCDLHCSRYVRTLNSALLRLHAVQSSDRYHYPVTCLIEVKKCVGPQCWSLWRQWLYLKLL